MRVSLEARVPLLDHLLVEFAVGLPGWMKRRDGEGKSILRKAIAARVPLTALHRPKHGFSVPLKQWLRKELRYRLDALLQPGAAVQAYVDLEAARRLVREHLSGRRDHSGILWRLIVLDLWLSGMQRGELDRPHSAAHLQFVAA